MATKILSKSEFLTLVECAAKYEQDDEALALVEAARKCQPEALGFCQMWADEMPQAMAYAARVQPNPKNGGPFSQELGCGV